MRHFKSFFKHTWYPQQMDNLQLRLNSNSNSNSTTTNTINNQNATDSPVISHNRQVLQYETELSEIKSSSIYNNCSEGVGLTTSANNPMNQRGVPCHGGACRSAGGFKLRPEQRLESPWHRLKTIFLIAIIVALIVWLIAYALLTRYELL